MEVKRICDLEIRVGELFSQSILQEAMGNSPHTLVTVKQNWERIYWWKMTGSLGLVLRRRMA